MANQNLMAKKTIAKVNPVTDALRKLKEEEAELISRLKPVQEAISALAAIIDKPAKKTSSSSAAKDNPGDQLVAEDEPSEAFQ